MKKPKRVTVVYECQMTEAELTAYIREHGDKPYPPIEVNGKRWTSRENYIKWREGDFN